MNQNAFCLTDKTILVTGASSGIGRQVAISCASAGANVILTGRSTERLNESHSNLNGNTHKIIAADLLNETDIISLVENLPQLDGVVHAAGIVKPFPIKFLTTDKINEMMRINFYSVVNLMAALFKMKKVNDEASIVFMSSVASHFPTKGNSMYASAKAALEAFAKTTALEYAHKKIRANCISPAMVKTPMYDYSAKGIFENAMTEHVQKYPLGVGMPEDIANAVLFFLFPASRWITGVNMIMDGGFTLTD